MVAHPRRRRCLRCRRQVANGSGGGGHRCRRRGTIAKGHRHGERADGRARVEARLPWLRRKRRRRRRRRRWGAPRPRSHRRRQRQRRLCGAPTPKQRRAVAHDGGQHVAVRRDGNERRQAERRVPDRRAAAATATVAAGRCLFGSRRRAPRAQKAHQ